MKQFFSFLMCLLLWGAFPVAAEEAPVTSDAVSTLGAEGWKAQTEADKKALAAQNQKIKENATAAKSEEKDLHQQIRDAKAAGDEAKAKELRAQLKATHQQNVSEMKQDRKELGAARKELRTDRKEARKSRADKNKDGAVDVAEKAKAKKRGWFGR